MFTLINRLDNSDFCNLILGSRAFVASDDASQIKPILSKKQTPPSIESLNRDLADGLRFDLINYIRSGQPSMKRSLLLLMKRYKNMFGPKLK